MNSFCVIEELGVWNFFFHIFPFLLKQNVEHCYVVDASSSAFHCIKIFCALLGKQIEWLRFRNVEIKDENGLLLRLRIPNQDMHDIVKTIISTSSFESLARLRKEDDLWRSFLVKSLVSFDPHDKETLFKALFLIHVCYQYSKQFKAPVTLFLNQRPWKSILLEYAKKHEVETVFVNSGAKRQSPLFFYFRILLLKILRWKWILRHRCFKTTFNKPSGPRLAVEYYGYFNFNRPELYSDFFFWQQSKSNLSSLSSVFRLPGAPLDYMKWETLKKHGIGAIVFDPRASSVSDVVPGQQKFPQKETWRLRRQINTLNLEKKSQGWAGERAFYYDEFYHFYRRIFREEEIRVYVSWFKYAPLLAPITAAIHSLEGIVAIYQRALDVTPFIETQLDTDVYFGYSKLVGEVEKKVGSKIPYFVVTGYLGDHRFLLLKPQVQRIRDQLLSSGAQFILSFTDEGSSDDGRWYTDHAFVQKDYSFLLEKLLQNKWLGLVIKPKVPRTLRRRLGSVAPLLEEALKTGRCYLYETGDLMGSYPPAVAALSADIAIHGYLSSPTAALEAALAGVPTLLLDREGWNISPLYQLGIGKVVFNEWDSLWEACLGKWKSDNKNNDLGAWSGLLDQLDPFRDGQATQRMSLFLQWLMEGFKQGLNRNDVLERAAKYYIKQWGSDKILSI